MMYGNLFGGGIIMNQLYYIRNKNGSTYLAQNADGEVYWEPKPSEFTIRTITKEEALKIKVKLKSRIPAVEYRYEIAITQESLHSKPYSGL